MSVCLIDKIHQGLYVLEISCHTLALKCVGFTGAALTGAESHELQQVLEETNVSVAFTFKGTNPF